MLYRPDSLTIDSSNNGRQNKDEEEVEAKHHELGGPFGFLQVIQEAGVGDDAAGKQIRG